MRADGVLVMIMKTGSGILLAACMAWVSAAWAVEIEGVTVRVRVPRQVQPEDGFPLAVMRRRQQSVHKPLVGVGLFDWIELTMAIPFVAWQTSDNLRSIGTEGEVKWVQFPGCRPSTDRFRRRWPSQVDRQGRSSCG